MAISNMGCTVAPIQIRYSERNQTTCEVNKVISISIVIAKDMLVHILKGLRLMLNPENPKFEAEDAIHYARLATAMALRAADLEHFVRISADETKLLVKVLQEVLVGFAANLTPDETYSIRTTELVLREALIPKIVEAINLRKRHQTRREAEEDIFGLD